MSNVFARRLIEVFIILLVMGGALKFFRGVLAASEGSFGTIAWPISSDSPIVNDLASHGMFDWSHGTLFVTGMPFARLFELGLEFAALALMIVAMLALRQLLTALSKGEIFTDANIVAFKRIGLPLFGVAAISVVGTLILQPLILSQAVMPEGYLLHPSISWNAKDVNNVWLEYDVPIFTFLLGALAMLTGEAFKSGKAYREDSESVV